MLGESQSFHRAATMDSIAEGETSRENSSNDEKSGDEKEESNSKKNFPQFTKPAPLDLKILEQVKISIGPETPISTLKGVFKISNSQSSLGKEELRKSEQQMKQAFVVFYRKLRLLKSYR